jgi:hypothetical protein
VSKEASYCGSIKSCFWQASTQALSEFEQNIRDPMLGKIDARINFRRVKAAIENQLFSLWKQADNPRKFRNNNLKKVTAAFSTDNINNHPLIKQINAVDAVSLLPLRLAWATFKRPRAGSSFFIIATGHDITYQVSYCQ